MSHDTIELMRRMPHTFTSLRHSVEKLLEAEYFLAGMIAAVGLEFQFQLNAFLSASRSVTFVLRKALSEVQGFVPWYERQQARMSADPAMRFFRELRNISQKEGPVSLVGGSLPDGGWTYRFVGRRRTVPHELIGRDACACCAVHLTKLATLLAGCAETFPFSSCPGRAFSEEGMEALGYSWWDVESALGLPPGYAQVGDFPDSERLRILSREIEPLDLEAIKRIAAGEFRANGKQLQILETSGTDLVDAMAAIMMRGGPASEQPRAAFVGAGSKRT